MFSSVTVKIMILGDSGVGKSQLFSRLVKKTFNENPLPTAGIDFATHMMKISSGQLVKAQIVDTSGLDRFRSIIQSYWALATGALVVYDITNRESFSNVRRWIRDFKAKCNKGFPPTIMVVGNKAEKESEPYREVGSAEAKAYAVAQGFYFMEVSAMENLGVDLAFSVVLTDVYHGIHDSANANTKAIAATSNSLSRGPSPVPDAGGSAAASGNEMSTLPMASGHLDIPMTHSRRASNSSFLDGVGGETSSGSYVEGTLSRLVNWVSGAVSSEEDSQGGKGDRSRRNSLVSIPSAGTNWWAFTPPTPTANDDAASISSKTGGGSRRGSPTPPGGMDGATRAELALKEAMKIRPPISQDDGEDDGGGLRTAGSGGGGLMSSTSSSSEGYGFFMGIARSLVGGGEEEKTPSPSLSSMLHAGSSPTYGSGYQPMRTIASTGGVVLPPRRESVAATVLETGIIPMPVHGVNHTQGYRKSSSSYARSSFSSYSPHPSSYDGEEAQSPTSDSAIGLSSSATTPTAGIMMLQMEPMMEDEDEEEQDPISKPFQPPFLNRQQRHLKIQPQRHQPVESIIDEEESSTLSPPTPLPAAAANAATAATLVPPPRKQPVRSASLIDPPTFTTASEHLQKLKEDVNIRELPRRFEMDLASLGGGLVDDLMSTQESTVAVAAAAAGAAAEAKEEAVVASSADAVACASPTGTLVNPAVAAVSDLARRNTVAGGVRRKKRAGIR
ncbi:hypothetical protein HDU97_008722 [Phlyctochytrium planicorne]|nr:hypothetical protein HDU97_008722 [Phlyctochytrium planicorne]